MSISEPVAGAGDADAARLAELGYAQELHRRMSGFSNFAVSFSIISILAGCHHAVRPRHERRWPDRDHSGLAVRRACSTLFVAWPWPRSARAYPTAGGLYCWAAALAKQQQARPGPGSSAGSTSSARSRSPPAIDFGAAFTSTALPRPAFGIDARPPAHDPACPGLILLLHGLLNKFGVEPGRAALRRQRLVAPRRRRGHRAACSPSCRTSTSRLSCVVRRSFATTPASARASTPSSSACCMAQYTLHRVRRLRAHAEETHDAARGGPRGIVMSTSWSRSSPAGSCSIALTFVDPELRRRAHTPDRAAARADLHRRGRAHRRQVPAVHLHRSPSCSAAWRR